MTAATRPPNQRDPDSHGAGECHPWWQGCTEELRASLADGNRERRGQTGSERETSDVTLVHGPWGPFFPRTHSACPAVAECQGGAGHFGLSGTDLVCSGGRGPVCALCYARLLHAQSDREILKHPLIAGFRSPDASTWGDGWAEVIASFGGSEFTAAPDPERGGRTKGNLGRRAALPLPAAWKTAPVRSQNLERQKQEGEFKEADASVDVPLAEDWVLPVRTWDLGVGGSGGQEGRMQVLQIVKELVSPSRRRAAARHGGSSQAIFAAVL
ncbi:hypothetical protein COCON_G00118160 [Conger conger]|uniref:Uncharacterized protein n=1 Tax=Conger conger TaxID=82655 RepID=A0A9Q1DGF5_CONCO|nr:hypothetical protein COCON_G00118160 [Conger conger]